ncbi:MAG: MFS transporter [Sphingobium sp.]
MQAESDRGRYVAEFRTHWRLLSAAALGMATGTALNIFTVALFAPSLIAEFGWSKSVFALHGTLALPFIFLGPVIGWLTDRYGVRRVAMVGIIGLPFTQIAASFMTGSIAVYFGLSFFQLMLGGTTTAMVYSRIVALNFREARGLALAFVASGTALMAALSSPLLGGIIDAYGWRTGYRCLAAFAAVSGLVVLLLMPSDLPARAMASEGQGKVRMRDYVQVVRSRAFLLIALGLCLCNMPHALMTGQFKVMLLDRGLDSASGSWILSLYSLGVVAGRFGCGLALDRFPSHIVAAVGLGFPAIGFFILGSPVATLPVIVAATATMGLAQGAEIDLLAYMTARHFASEVYGTVVSLIYGGMVVSATIGSVILSATLHYTGSFVPFIMLLGVVSLIGASMFIPLGSGPRAPKPAAI